MAPDREQGCGLLLIALSVVIMGILIGVFWTYIALYFL